MCFSFAAKMTADTNQLKELRELLRAGGMKIQPKG